MHHALSLGDHATVRPGDRATGRLCDWAIWRLGDVRREKTKDKRQKTKVLRSSLERSKNNSVVYIARRAYGFVARRINLSRRIPCRGYGKLRFFEFSA